MNQDHNLHLDNFFNAARNEAPLVSDQDLERLIDPHAPVADSTSVMSSHSGRTLSAFKPSGGFMIAGLGLGAASVVLVAGYLATSEPQPTGLQKQPIAVAPSSSSSNGSARALPTPSYPELATSNDAKKSTSLHMPSFIAAGVPAMPREPIAPKAPVAVFDSMWERVTIERIKPIELTREQIEALGVVSQDDGLIEVYHQTNDGKLAMRMAFPPPIPFSDDDLSPFVDREKIKGRIARVMPTMVTDMNGKKLAFFFKSNESLPGMQFEAMNLSQRDGDESSSTEVEKVTTVQEFNGAEGIDLSSLDDLEGLKEFEAMRNLPEIQELIKGLKIEVQKGGSDGDGKSLRMKMSHRKGITDSIRMDKNGGAKAFAFKFDTTGKFSIPDDFQFDMKFDMDSLKNLGMQFQLDAKDIEKGVQKLNKLGLNLKINVDSIQKEVMKYMNNFDMKQFKDFKFDTNMMKNFNFDLNINRKGEKLSLDSRVPMTDQDSIREFVREQMKSVNREDIRQLRGVKREDIRFDRDGFRILNLANQMAKINSLVPVQILAKNTGTKFNQNGLLFWYDPMTDASKEEVLAAIAQNSVQHSASINSAKVVKGSTVYPNPAIGKTTLDYTLSEPAVVSIAVYDLLGKQMFEVVHAEPKQSGAHSASIDLNTIPDGVYLLVLVTDKGEQITQRLVVGQ